MPASDFIFDPVISAEEKHSFCRKWLCEFEKLNLLKLSYTNFAFSKWKDQVTLLFHSFWPNDYEFNEFPILHTWKMLGRLPVVIITDKETGPMIALRDRFADDISIQISPDLKRGDVLSLSRDCLNNLYRYFNTPYCLIIQDDGFPIRSNLDDFIGKWDYVGAPFVRDTPRQYLADILLKNCLNGGFSLRSRRYCEAVCEEWSKWGREAQKKHGWKEEEDWFYSVFSRKKLSHRLRFKFPWSVEARKFAAMDILGIVDLRKYSHMPFGVHSPTTCYFYQKELRKLGYELPKEPSIE